MSKRFVFLYFLSIMCVGALSAGCDVGKAAAESYPRAETANAQHRAQATAIPDTASAKVVQAVTLQLEKFVSQLETSGKALAVRESYLSCPVPGVIKEILVKRGDQVKKGQVLLRFDRTGFMLSVEQAEGALAAAAARADQVGNEIARMKQLLASGAAPSATMDQLEAEGKAARAQEQMARAALSQAHKALRDSEVRAPYHGVITEILKQEGEQAPSMPHTILMKIVDTAELEVQTFVPEESGRFVRVGMAADVEIESADTTAEGQVVFVSDAIQQGSRTFEVRIRIANPERRIKAGSFARVRLNEQTRENAILIPLSSLKRDEQNNPYVYLAENGVARKTDVTLGSLPGARALVLSGLSANQRLITTEIESLSDGQPIVIEQ